MVFIEIKTEHQVLNEHISPEDPWCHDIAEILLKLALSTNESIKPWYI
jgi:hypothetical protein